MKFCSHSNPMILALAAIVFCVATPLQSDDDLVQTSVNKANEVIDLALEAHGGKQRLSALNSIAQDRTILNYATEQSRLPDPPWDQSNQLDTTAFDLQKGIYMNQGSGAGGGFEFSTRTIINGEDSWQLDFRAGTAARIAEPDLNTASGPFVRVTAPLVLKQFDNRRQVSHWLGVADFEGRPHDVVTLVMEVGPGLSAYFDQETHMLRRMERVLPPFGRVEYRFDDYELVDGIPINQNFRLILNGEPNLDIHIVSTKLNGPIEPYAVVPADLKQVAEIVTDDFRLQEIDEGLFLVGGNGSYGLFVEMEDHIVALGGTQGVADRFAEVRKHIADKPLRYGVLTHHHNDHIAGSADFSKAGATIVTFRENAARVKAVADNADAKLEFVGDRLTLGDGKRVIELIDIGPTPHSEHMLIAWLPHEKIVFEGDQVNQPIVGPIVPAISSTRILAEALAKKGLDFERIVSEHSPRIVTAAELAEAVRQPPAVNAGAH